MKAPISRLDRATLRALLAVERDAVRRRRELVPASLLRDPAEGTASGVAPLGTQRA